MAIIHLFHGTSASSYLDIIKNGFSNKEDTIWSCSDYDKTYMYQLDKFAECEGIENWNLDEQIEMLSQRANESAQITQCFVSPEYKYTVVFEFLVDTDKTDFMDHVEDDDSCENMSGCGAVQIDNEILDKAIKNGTVKVFYHFFPYYTTLWVFYLAGISRNDFLQDKIWGLNYMQKKSLDMVKELDYCSIYEDIICVDEIESSDYFHYGITC